MIHGISNNNEGGEADAAHRSDQTGLRCSKGLALFFVTWRKETQAQCKSFISPPNQVECVAQTATRSGGSSRRSGGRGSERMAAFTSTFVPA